MYGCVSGHDVRLRMCGWQDRLNSEDGKLRNDALEDTNSTYGTETGTGDEDSIIDIDTYNAQITKGVTVMKNLDILTPVGNHNFDASLNNLYDAMTPAIDLDPSAFINDNDESYNIVNHRINVRLSSPNTVINSNNMAINVLNRVPTMQF